MWRRTHITAGKEINKVEGASHYGCSLPSFSRSARYGYGSDISDRGKMKLNKKPLKLTGSIVDEKAPVYRVGDLIKSHRSCVLLILIFPCIYARTACFIIDTTISRTYLLIFIAVGDRLK